MNSVETDLLKFFKVMVLDYQTPNLKKPHTGLIDNGVILDFQPDSKQTHILREFYKPLHIRTLFSREEREEGEFIDLIVKQLLHYIEIYGLDEPGTFDLEMDNGKMATLNYVRGVTINELGEMIKTLVYRNAPIKDPEILKRIIDYYDLGSFFDINKVENNESRILLATRNTIYKSGDDAVRAICYFTTKSTMLIKSNSKIRAIRSSKANVDLKFLDSHIIPLSQVFNRHKRIILAIKTDENAKIINLISRLSKKNHVPIFEPIQKRFVHTALYDRRANLPFLLKKVSIRDKFKYLNLLEQKRLSDGVETYFIRNGKIWVKRDCNINPKNSIDYVIEDILISLDSDLSKLREKKILMDPNVKYGLPISRKQTFGNLPYGTLVETDGFISSGMYWENEWGSRDLDLSAIDEDGKRVGWGQKSGYTDKEIVYSGDLTDARNGAMEFMTSSSHEYGLFINIYSGQTGSEFELVVGNDDQSREHWISNIIIREREKLESRKNLIGFVRQNQFIVWTGRIGSTRVSSRGDSIYAKRMKAKMWTINDILDKLKIEYNIEKMDNIEYDYDLTYNGFTMDKLEEMIY